MMIDQLPSEDKRKALDISYFQFKMRLFAFKTLINSIWIWLCAPAYLIPTLMALNGNYWVEILLWTVGSYFMTCIVIFVIGYPIALWYNRVFVKNYWWALGDKVIFVHRGVLSRQLARVPYTRIQNVNWRQSLFERWNGFYRIEIETAGSGRVIAEGVIIGIKDPEPIIREISMHIQSKMVDLDEGDNISPIKAPMVPKSGSISDDDLFHLLQSIDNNLKEIKNILEKR